MRMAIISLQKGSGNSRKGNFKWILSGNPGPSQHEHSC